MSAKLQKNEYSALRKKLSQANRSRKKTTKQLQLFVRKAIASDLCRVIPASLYAKNNAIFTLNLVEKTDEKLPGPKFIDQAEFPLNTLTNFRSTHPPIQAYQINNSKLLGRCPFVFKEKDAIVPDSFDLTKFVTALENFGQATYQSNKNSYQIWSKQQTSKNKGISLITEHPANYAHFLTEILPKFILIDEIEKFRDYPLIFDDSVPTIFLSIIELFSQNPREYIFLEQNKFLSLDSCIYIESTAFTPTHIRDHWESGIQVGATPDFHTFSKPALQALRNKAIEKYSSEARHLEAEKQLLLVRDPSSSFNKRNVVNWNQIRRKLENSGFNAYNPARQPFTDQVKTFAEAKRVTSEVGAALVNTLFCKTSCEIWCLAPYFKQADYYYFSNLAQILGHKLVFIVGPKVNDDQELPKEVGDYLVSIEYFDELLSKAGQISKGSRHMSCES